MLKILGAGLPRTGTKTLCSALGILGHNAIHHDRPTTPLFPSDPRGFWDCGVFPGVDAVLDCPAALYWREIAEATKCRVILTTRDPDSWWESIKWHTNRIRNSENMPHIQYTDTLHGLLFGVAQPDVYWWKRRFLEHNQMVRDTFLADRLLELDIVAGGAWDVLCPFLGVKEPTAAWPWEHRRRRD